MTINPKLYPGSRRWPFHDSEPPTDLLISEPKNAIRNIPANNTRKETEFAVFINPKLDQGERRGAAAADD